MFNYRNCWRRTLKCCMLWTGPPRILAYFATAIGVVEEHKNCCKLILRLSDCQSTCGELCCNQNFYILSQTHRNVYSVSYCRVWKGEKIEHPAFSCDSKNFTFVVNVAGFSRIIIRLYTKKYDAAHPISLIPILVRTCARSFALVETNVAAQPGDAY